MSHTVIPYRRRAIGNRAPKGNFVLNKDSIQAQGLDHWMPVVNGDALSALRDFSPYNRPPPDDISSPGVPTVETALTAKFGVHFTAEDFHTQWTSGKYAWMAKQAFTRVVRFYFTGDVSALSDTGGHSLWTVGNRADISIGASDSGQSAGEMGAYWYDGAFRNLSAGTVASTDQFIVHEIVYSHESGDQRLYLDGNLVDSSTLSAAIIHSTVRSAGLGGREWSVTHSPPMVVIHALQSGRAWKDAEAAHSWHPQTRWDLYYQPGRRFISIPAGGGDTINAGAPATMVWTENTAAVDESIATNTPPAMTWTPNAATIGEGVDAGAPATMAWTTNTAAVNESIATGTQALTWTTNKATIEEAVTASAPATMTWSTNQAAVSGADIVTAGTPATMTWVTYQADIQVGSGGTRRQRQISSLVNSRRNRA